MFYCCEQAGDFLTVSSHCKIRNCCSIRSKLQLVFYFRRQCQSNIVWSSTVMVLVIYLRHQWVYTHSPFKPNSPWLYLVLFITTYIYQHMSDIFCSFKNVDLRTQNIFFESSRFLFNVWKLFRMLYQTLYWQIYNQWIVCSWAR